MNKLKDHVYEFDEVLIGLTTSSLLYSYIFNLPIIYKLRNRPRFFEFIDNSVDLTKTGFLKENKELILPKGKKIFSYSKRSIMDHLYFIQCLCGNIPFRDDDISEIRVNEEDKLLKIITNKQRIFKYKFNKLRVFDTRELNFLTSTGNSTEKKYVLDEFELKIKNDKFYNIIPTEFDFPKEIYIASDKKRLMSYSLLTLDQINDPEYSSWFITKQIQSILSKLNLKADLLWTKRTLEEKDPLEYKEEDWLIIDKRNEEEIWKLKKVNTYRIWSGSFRSRLVQRMRDSLGLLR